MIDGVDTSKVDPTVDDGADRSTRPKPCTRRTWCIRTEHPATERCVERPREKRDLGDPLPSLRSPSFTEQLRKANSR